MFNIEETKIISIYKDELTDKSIRGSYSDSSVGHHVSGSTATIFICGELVNESLANLPYWIRSYYCSTPDISALLSKLERDNSISNYVFNIESGGGEVDGISNLATQIQNLSKPTVAVTDTICASAAYWLASSCNEIIATSKTARFGSIGVLTRSFDTSKYITNRESPAKVPNTQTDEGKAVVQNRLSDIYNIFIESVAAGRGTSTEHVKATYGNGDVFIAEKALANGLIDKVNLDFSKSKSENKAENITTNYSKIADFISEKVEKFLDKK